MNLGEHFTPEMFRKLDALNRRTSVDLNGITKSAANPTHTSRVSPQYAETKKHFRDGFISWTNYRITLWSLLYMIVDHKG